MFSISHFFMRVKGKILRDSLRMLRSAYYNHVHNIHGDVVEKGDILLNIGAGNWHCKGWINLDYPSEWYAKAQSHHEFMPYDIRNDKIPFEADAVKAVYCSHVIEHIEDRYIQPFFAEVHRVLKTGGVFRIACPDAEFLWEVSRFDNDYWYWREYWMKSPQFVKKPLTASQVDQLVHEVATAKFPEYVNSIENNREEYTEKFRTMGMNEFFEYITSGLEYRTDFLQGDHINFWTFGKVKAFLENAGFTTIIRSKYLGSVCRAMCNPARFDTTEPQMSLYAEAVK